MPNALNAFFTAIMGVINGTILYCILTVFVDSGLLSSTWLIVYNVVNLLTIFTFVHATRYWGTFYLLGWWLGFGIMYYTRLVGVFEFAIDSILLGLVLLSRFLRK